MPDSPTIHPPQRASSKKHRPHSIVAPPIVRATAALAWLVAAICFMRAAVSWNQGGEQFTDAVFFLGIGGGAAYLGMALPRRVVSAWRACRQLARTAGTINMVVLPALIVACLLAVGFRLWSGVDPALPDWSLKLSAAVAATALPWAFYHALGDNRVRSWFCAVDCR